MIILQGKPISRNTLYASVCRGKFPTVYMTPKGKELKASYEAQVKKQWKEETIKGDVSVSIVYFLSDNRKVDLDNINKSTIDSLTGIVFDDDKQIKELYLRKEVDKSNPRTVIEIMEL